MSQPQPSSSRWAKYSIASLSAASTATSFGFTAAKLGTRLGFGAARTVTSTAANLAGLSIDYALFGSNKGTSLALQSLTEPTLSFIESVALTPILVGETITSTSFVAARTSVDAICAISAALGGTSANSGSDPNNSHDNALTTMSTMYPGSDDASFSLASFVQLVRREWNEPVFRERVPPDRKLSVSEVARALVAWGVLQAVTQGWQENRWFTALKEIRLDVPEGHSSGDSSSGGGGNRSSVGGLTMRSRKPSRLKVTGEEGPVITADIGEAERSLERDGKRALSPISDQYWSRYGPTSQHHQIPPRPSPPPRLTNEQLKSTLRRLSKMVLGGYGGAGFIFFGVSYHPQVPTSTSTSSSSSSSSSSSPAQPSSQSTTESTMNQIITAAEEEADSCASDPAPRPIEPKQYSWWNVLLGRHDQELFERYAFLGDAHHHHDTQPRSTAQDDNQTSNTRSDDNNRGRHESHDSSPSPASPITEKSGTAKGTLPKSTAVLGKESEMPRYWVLTDHGRKQIVLVFRGTMSLNELAVDLTCEPAPFKLSHASTKPPNFPNPEPHPTPHPSYPYQPFPSSSPNSNGEPKSGDAGADDNNEPVYEVHSGMLRIALYMGARGRPVHTAVADALRKNSRYELVLCGHSLGAGVAALLALSWADPSTCLTVPSSGLPPGRRVSCYCFAPPCITDAPLSRLASDMITSFVYSHDIVSRLSLGSVRDMFCATAWLAVGDLKQNTAAAGVDETGKSKVEAKKNTGEGSASVTARAIKWKTGFGSEGDEEWFLALRKTLEANMTMTHLYPPGRIWWAVRDGDLHPSNRLPTTSSSTPPSTGNDKNTEKEKEKEREKTLAAKKVRLFEVTDVEKVFSQIVFARDMLTSHLPDRYDYVLHELL